MPDHREMLGAIGVARSRVYRARKPAGKRALKPGVDQMTRKRQFDAKTEADSPLVPELAQPGHLKRAAVQFIDNVSPQYCDVRPDS